MVAGVPSLADFDVIIDAGSDKSDPENAVPFNVKTPAGKVFEQPGNFFGLIETSLWGTEPKYAAKGVEPDLNDNGKVEFGEAVPDADFLVAAAKDFATNAKELDEAANGWEPNEQDAFTALVVMTPTMSEYFESWKASRFVAGAKSDQSTFVAASRLGDIAGILNGLVLVYDSVEPSVTKAEPRAGEADRRRPQGAARVRRRPARPGGIRQEVHGPGRRHARLGRPGSGRGDRRPDQPGRRRARDQARDVSRAALVAALIALAVPASASAAEPWRAASDVRDALFDAQTQLIIGTPGDGRGCGRARRQGLPRAAAQRDPVGRPVGRPRGPRSARCRREGGPGQDSAALAAARGAAAGSDLPRLVRGDARRRRPRRRRRRQELAAAARVPDRDAVHAPGRERDARGQAAGGGQARRPPRPRRGQEGPARRLPGAPARAARRCRPRRRAQSAGPARRGRRPGGRLLRDPRRPLRGGQGRGRGRSSARAAYADLRETALGDDLAAFSAARDRAAAALEGFTAAPFTPEEAARRAQQLLRFLALVPVEYGRGVKDTTVHLDFEIQEAAAFHTGATAAFADLRDQLAKLDAARTETAAAGIEQLGQMVKVATEQREGVPDAGRGRGRDQEGRGRAECRRCPQPGRRAPTSPTTT